VAGRTTSTARTNHYLTTRYNAAQVLLGHASLPGAYAAYGSPSFRSASGVAARFDSDAGSNRTERTTPGCYPTLPGVPEGTCIPTQLQGTHVRQAINAHCCSDVNAGAHGTSGLPQTGLSARTGAAPKATNDAAQATPVSTTDGLRMVRHPRWGRLGGLVLIVRDFMIGPLTNRGHPWVPTVGVRREEIIFGMNPRLS
jgi:hypothetical protein